MSRSNWLWPLLIVVGAGLLIALTAGAIPPTVSDLIGRAWPILIVIFGLNGLIGRRIRFANFLILGLSILLTAGVIVTAYGKQSGQLRSEYQAQISQALAPDVKSIRLNITTLLAQLDVSFSEGSTITGNFSGSVESKLESAFTVAEGVGTLTLTESRTSAIPKLENIGRGKLTLILPAGLSLDDLTLRGGDGELMLRAGNATLKNLNIRLQKGTITATLPSLPPESALGGTLRTDSGDLTLTVPAGLTLRLTVEAGNPTFNPASYLRLSSGEVQSIGVRDFQAVLTVGASGAVNVKP